jgi:hypothetical protein
MVEIAGPVRKPMNEFVEHYLKATNDPRTVIVDPSARYFEVEIDEHTLVPDDGARLGNIRFDDWMRSPAAQKK